MLSPSTKAKILENFYAIDYVFFGKPISEVNVCCPIFVEEYMTLKGALVSSLIEMYNNIGYSVKNTIVESFGKDSNKFDNILRENALRNAKEAMMNSRKVLASEKGKKYIKECINNDIKKSSDRKKKFNLESTIQKQISKKSYSLGVDNLLISNALKESENVGNVDNWNGGVISETYRTLRTNLIDCVMAINENTEN